MCSICWMSRQSGLVELDGSMECCMIARVLLHLCDEQAMLQAKLLPMCAVGQGIL